MELTQTFATSVRAEVASQAETDAWQTARRAMHGHDSAAVELNCSGKL